MKKLLLITLLASGMGIYAEESACQDIPCDYQERTSCVDVRDQEAERFEAVVNAVRQYLPVEFEDLSPEEQVVLLQQAISARIEDAMNDLTSEERMEIQDAVQRFTQQMNEFKTIITDCPAVVAVAKSLGFPLTLSFSLVVEA